ncbi:SCO4225 family membrane protein [Streptomyces sp. NPDC085596]|uniref:SCO4225 family membrane protein n=1 Tax=Streptomyces sp. NPDC085596 TaxID=3365731 RepID=UPI0037D888B2
MPHAIRPRRLLSLATGNWLARSYLVVLAASVLAMLVFPESALAMSPLVLTAPLSLLAMAFPFGPGTEGSVAVEVLATGFSICWLLLGALGNAAVLGALATRSAARTGEAPSANRVRALLVPAVDNWLSRGYLAVVAAAVGSFLYAVYVSPDPGFAGIWPLITTAPLSIVALMASAPLEDASSTWLSSLVFTVGTVLAGLFNAVLLGRLARSVRG